MKKFFYLFTGLALFACKTEKHEQATSDILPRQKFVSLLIRMHVLDARISFSQVVDMQAAEKNQVAYRDLLQQYHTDSTTVSNTFGHYQNRPQEMLEIYQEVRDSLVVQAQKTVKSK